MTIYLELHAFVHKIEQLNFDHIFQDLNLS